MVIENAFIKKLQSNITTFIHTKYKKPALIASICMLFILFASIFGSLLSRSEETLFVDSEYHLTDGATASVLEDIALPMGIYDFTVSYQTNANALYALDIEDGTVFEGGLLSSLQAVFAGKNEVTFRVWLYESTEHLRLFTKGYTEEALYINSLTIKNTGRLWTCILVIAIAVYFLFLGILRFLSLDIFGKISPEKKKMFFWISLLTLLLSTPLFIDGMYIIGDINYHLERVQGVVESLQNHVFPMRLQSNFPFGYGYADGILYGSTLLYIPAFFVLLGFPLTISFNLFLILVNLATVWISMVCFQKMFQNNTNLGIICSSLYSFSIYRITVFYGRGCLGEGCGEIFLPLLLYGYYRLLTESEKKYTWILLVIGYSGILQTHTLTAELSIFWTVILCLICIKKVLTKPVFKQLLVGALVTILCNLWFLLPFLDYYISQDMLIKNIGTKTIQFQGIQLSEIPVHFFNAVLEYEDGWPIRAVGPGLLPCLALLGYVIYMFYSYATPTEKASASTGGTTISSAATKKTKTTAYEITPLKKTSIICASFSIVSLILGLRIFPWDKIQMISPLSERLVSSLLIPTRFLNWTALFMVPVIGYLFFIAYEEYLHPQTAKTAYAYPIAIFLLFLQIGSSALYFVDHIASDYDRSNMYENQVVGYVSGGEYLLYGTDETILTYSSFEASANAAVSFYEKKPLAADLTLSSTDGLPAYVDLPLFAYKGYRLFTMDKNIPLTESAIASIDSADSTDPMLTIGDNNRLRVQIPGDFSGQLSVGFVSPISWRLSEIISLLTVFCLTFFCKSNYKIKRKITF